MKNKCIFTCLNKLLNSFYDISIELFDLDGTQVHMAEQAVDNLEERLLHAGKALIQQLRGEENHWVKYKKHANILLIHLMSHPKPNPDKCELSVFTSAM